MAHRLSDKRLIVGLGNPGEEYTYTRHNIGFLIVSRIAEKNGFRFRRASGMRALVSEGQIEGASVVLVLPQAFMNNSGPVVKQAVSSKGIAEDHLLVVSDDFNLTFGQMRIRSSGSDGGHNGLASLIEHLGTRSFARLRVGIGPVPPHHSTVDFVLREFQVEEKKELKGMVEAAAECCHAWVKENINTVMSRYNQKLAE